MSNSVLAHTRPKTLQLYRQILRTGKNWMAKEPKNTLKERNWILSEARKGFHANMNVRDPQQIQQLLRETEDRYAIAVHYQIPYPRRYYAKPGAIDDGGAIYQPIPGEQREYL
ncbi:hypothetical protein QOT17_012450 [Balamuthia mandrillaris]